MALLPSGTGKKHIGFLTDFEKIFPTTVKGLICPGNTRFFYASRALLFTGVSAGYGKNPSIHIPTDTSLQGKYPTGKEAFLWIHHPAHTGYWPLLPYPEN